MTGTNAGIGDRSGYQDPADQATQPFAAGPLAEPVVLAAALAAGGLATVLLPNTDRIGVGLTVSAAALAVPGLLSARRRGRAGGRPFGRVNAATVAVAAGLLLVPTFRASDWLAVCCLFAAAGLVAVVQLDVRRLTPVVLAGPLIAWAGLRTPAWLLASVQDVVPGLPRPSGRAARAWTRGLLVGGAVVVVVGALLASADVVFARLVEMLWPTVDVGQVPAYAVTFVVTTALALAGAYAGAHRVRRRWLAADGRTDWRTDGEPGHPAEWLVPLVLASVVLAVFLAVQVTALFGGAADTVLREEGLSYADRARQGFAQLTVVTLILVALLTWAGRAGAGHRRLLAGAGGTLLALTLLLAASALRRLWLYDDAYGWTVRRVNAAAFEIWLVAALLGLGVLWLTRRTELAPRLVIGSAGAGLLCLALANPEAMVARADLHRFEQTQKIDVDYLAGLSADATPALAELPPAERQLVLSDLRDSFERLPDTWRTWNLPRHRAQGTLETV